MIPVDSYDVHFVSAAGDTLIITITSVVRVDRITYQFDEVIEAAITSAVNQGVNVDRPDVGWDVEAIHSGGVIVWPH